MKNVFILISVWHDEYGTPMVKDNIGVFSKFETAYSKYMSEPIEDSNGNQLSYYIEEWNIDGEHVNNYRCIF